MVLGKVLGLDFKEPKMSREHVFGLRKKAEFSSGNVLEVGESFLLWASYPPCKLAIIRSCSTVRALKIPWVAFCCEGSVPKFLGTVTHVLSWLMGLLLSWVAERWTCQLDILENLYSIYLSILISCVWNCIKSILFASSLNSTWKVQNRKSRTRLHCAISSLFLGKTCGFLLRIRAEGKTKNPGRASVWCPALLVLAL